MVIFAHGYKGFKDWGSWDSVAREFVDAGFDFLKFNFSHNGGTVQNPIDFPDLEAFSQNTYSKELSDLEIIHHMALQGIKTSHGVKHWRNTAIIGHSRGGGIVLIHAAFAQNVCAVATWASVAHFGERFTANIEEWKKKGTITVKNARTKQDLPHKYDFYHDYITHQEKLSILSAAKKIKIPWIIIHGNNDESVDINNAERLASQNKNAQMHIVKNGGHTFNTAHPATQQILPAAMHEVVQTTINFFLHAGCDS